MTGPQNKKIKIEMSLAETRIAGCRTILTIYDVWKESRKLQPVYEMELTPYEISYLIGKLADALIGVENHVKVQRLAAIASLKEGSS